ncbi:hypothetical protein [Bacillus infantis]|uniref:hypothetical protein n=1 Tax=Bacillus infantis TaxID=324767 RepID=UPI0020A11464|nr:hypothetical protein [Bacillus infantis]MCP1159379.1 hypothetical protein [Bacillus infantis]
MFEPELIGKKVEFRFIDEDYKETYGLETYIGEIVNRGSKNYIACDIKVDDEWQLDYFETYEVEFKIIE